MKYYAHSVKERGEEAWQTICEHAKNTARLCAQFAARWCDETYACDLGLLHDIGKYQPDFQRRIRGENVQIEHAVCGAKECAGYGMGPLAAYCIAGHHAGLPDAGTPVDRADEGTLLGKLKRETQDYGAYRQELQPERIAQPPMRIPLQGGAAANKQIAFWVRMTFSALTDADFLDTERFCNGAPPPPATLDGCLEKLTRAMGGLPAESAVCRARNALLEQALSHCEEDAHLYLMNMPTGSGKTLASMRFALEQAKRRGLDRVIYVIPYTSIIEQNAAVFRSIFGEDAVLEHHCNFDGDTLENADTAQKLARAAENWDAPVIVTTNVQFFRSVYGNKPSQVRKLHNVANSMLVFDEVHMFPSAFWQPCLEAVKLLVTDYSCRALFLTATMPDFRTWLAQFDCGGMRICDLIGDTSPFGAFERCSVEDAGALSLAQLVAAAAAAQSALIVVNTRRTAKAVYDSLPGEKYHLSTYMTRRDRVRTIGQVREARSRSSPPRSSKRASIWTSRSQCASARGWTTFCRRRAAATAKESAAGRTAAPWCSTLPTRPCRQRTRTCGCAGISAATLCSSMARDSAPSAPILTDTSITTGRKCAPTILQTASRSTDLPLRAMRAASASSTTTASGSSSNTPATHRKNSSSACSRRAEGPSAAGCSNTPYP